MSKEWEWNRKLMVNHLTGLILCFNALIDSGKYDHLTIDEVKSHITSGDVLGWLEDRVGSDAWSGLSFIRERPKPHQEYIERLQAIREAYGGDESRKWGVRNRGLCLLLAWTNEILQQGEDLEWSRL